MKTRYIGGIVETTDRKHANAVFAKNRSALMRERHGVIYVFVPAHMAVGHATTVSRSTINGQPRAAS